MGSLPGTSAGAGGVSLCTTHHLPEVVLH